MESKRRNGTMTATEMIPAVGQTVSVRFEDLQIQCTVRDVKHVYGQPLLDVEPVAGEGRQWVSLNRVRLVFNTKAPEWAITNGLIGEGK